MFNYRMGRVVTGTIILALGLALSPAQALVVSFDVGSPSDIFNGGSLVTTPGTVAIGEVATYHSGGGALTGLAASWPNAATPAFAASAIDHVWLQYDPKIVYKFTSARNQVVAVPGIDHLPLPGEALEFIIWGSNAAGALLEEGAITKIYEAGVDGTTGVFETLADGPLHPPLIGIGESDDFTSIWKFNGSYTYFVAKSGDHILNFSSANEGEIDGLAAIPAPGAALLALMGLGTVRRFRRRLGRA